MMDEMTEKELTAHYLQHGYYKYHLYQVSGSADENDAPIALFAHGIEARAAADHLASIFPIVGAGLRFVLTDVSKGESYVA